MSDGANASAKLSASFPEPSVLTDLVGQLKNGVGGVKAPDIPTDKIQSLTAGLNIQLPDTSNWHTTIPPDAKSLTSNFPDAATLTQPITEPISKVSGLLSFDFASQVQSIGSSFGANVSLSDPESILSPLEATVAAGVNLLKDPELQKLFDLVGSVTGSEEVKHVPDYAETAGNAVQTVLKDNVEPPIVAFSALVAAMSVIGRLQERVSNAGSFNLQDTQRRLQDVLGAYGALAGQIRGGGAVDTGAATGAFTTFMQSLVSDMALTEATLATLGTSDAEATYQEIQGQLAKLDTQSLNALAGKLTTLIEGAGSRMKFDADLNIDKYKQLVHTGLGQLNTEIDKLDPSKLSAAVESGFQTVLSPLKKLEDFKAQVETIIRGVLQTIHDAIAKIDLAPLKNTVQQALNALEGVLQQLATAFEDLRNAIQSALNSVKTVLDSVKSFVLDPQSGLKKKIEDVFHSISDVLKALNIQQVVAEVSGVLKPMSDELAKIEFAPVINAVVDAIGVITTALKTVAPLLATDALKQKLGEAADFLKQIDLNQIADDLNQEFDGIMASVDQDALGEFKAEYDQVVESLGKFDPGPALDEVQKEVFDPLLAELEQIHPAETLKPVQDAFDKAAAALEGFDPTVTFSFLTDFFKSLLEQIDSISPAKMLEPVQKTLDDVRAQIIAFLRIDDILALLSRFKGFIEPILNGADLEPFLSNIGAGYNQMKAGIAGFDPASFFASLISSGSTSGVVLAIGAILSDSNDLTPKLSALGAQLQSGNDHLAGFDATGALASLRAGYADVGSAVVARSGTPLADDAAAAVKGLDPMASLAPLLPKIERVKAAFAAKIAQFSQSAAKLMPTLQAVGGTLPPLRALVSPLTLLKDFFLEPVRRLFPGQQLSSFKDVASHFFDQFDLADIVADLRAIATTVLGKLKAVIDDAVLNPVSDVLQSVKSALDVLNIHPLVDAINSLFQDLEAAVKQLDPTPIIQEIGAKYKEIVALLEKLNPAQFIAQISDIYDNEIVGVVKAISPRDLLLPPLKELFAEISGALGAFDIEALFKPILDRLKALDTDLSDGLHKTGAAYEQMLAVLASATGEASVSASVSVG